MAVDHSMMASCWSIQTWAASPRATTFGTASVPARRPSSWPPPRRKDGKTRGRFTYRAATPFGAPNLCPTRVKASTPRLFTSTGILPTAWAASAWTTTKGSLAFTASTIAFTSTTLPTSLFASITDTTAVSPGRTASATSAAETKPRASQPTIVAFSSNVLTHSRIAGCSMADVTTCVRPVASMAPRIAQLSASLPQLQKIISDASSQRNIRAIRSRAKATAFRHGSP
mmetsp:Transcript_15342/g.50145  ORF Transcript_15342/g.50145 Transcript_15342/m.50145 type:complete len:228 (+) Transcript_15342:1352-2035(+)